MRRFTILMTVTLAAAATGCIYEREAVRDDRRVDAPPPAPPDTYSPAPDPGYQSYQSEAPPPPAGSEVSSEAVFYERLSPYGHWTFVAPYGRVWVPAVGWGWRPYYYGRWVLTDWGWTFASDDPWGWAAYHYGRWNWAGGVGWYWIPGNVWAPAWVSWRYGAGYVTWCPLGPAGIAFGYRHPAWIAVSEQHFTRPIAAVAVPSQRTYGAVTQARPLAGPHATVARSGSFGPPVASVARATGQQIRPVAAAQAVRPRSTTARSSPRDGAMRSPVQPRARTGVARPAPTGGPRAAPARPSTAPRSGSPSGGPRAAPSGGGERGGGPRAAPSGGGERGGGGPRAAPSGGGERGGGHGGGPHATSGRSQ
jgi:uncharacterized membrane protein YgcG